MTSDNPLAAYRLHFDLPVKWEVMASPHPASRAPSTLHRTPTALSLVAVGGAVGALARYGSGKAWPTASGHLPWTTFAINLLGAFILGFTLEALRRHGSDAGMRRHLRLLVGTGFCGAFTTYSTFAHDIVTLAHHSGARACWWAVFEVTAGFVMAALGLALANLLPNRMSGGHA